MAILKDFAIYFEQPFAVYYPGQFVSGYVVVQIDEGSINITGIKLHAYGRGYTKILANFRNTTFDLENNNGVECDNYLDRTEYIYGEGRKFLMPVGRHHLKFKFQLPYNMLPSSYEGGINCYIRYTLTATMIRPWAIDYITTKAFTILEKIDLNVPELTEAAGSEDFESSTRCFSCLSTPLKLSATTDRTGYCPGENVKVCILLENIARKRLKEVVIKLVQNVIYVANELLWNNQKVYEKVRINNITKIGDSVEWKDQLLPIPCLPPTSKACRTIHLQYSILVKVSVWSGYNLTVKIPIVIGTKPLQQSQGNDGSLPIYKYKDCVDGKTDIQDKNSQKCLIGGHTFIPQYPYIVN